MPVIYRPKGRAAEYSPLAVNLYAGCEHGCKYCYVPWVLRKTHGDFRLDPKPKKQVLARLIAEAAKWKKPKERVLLCFACDPYQPCEERFEITNHAIETLGEAGFPISVLTKNPAFAWERDEELFKRYDVEFGVTLTFDNDQNGRYWEPRAAKVQDRIYALIMARREKVKTWVSFEPVIDPMQTLRLMKAVRGVVDTFKVGKLNHEKKLKAVYGEDLVKRVDWGAFVEEVLKVIGDKPYLIKDDLWEYAGKETRKRFRQSTIGKGE